MCIETAKQDRPKDYENSTETKQTKNASKLKYTEKLM